MRSLKKALISLVLLYLGCFSKTVLANNTVSLIRTPVSIQKSSDFCFRQQGEATSYYIAYSFADAASGTLSVDGNLVDSFPPTSGRSTQVPGLFKDGVHKITLTVDKEATLTTASLTAFGGLGSLNLFPILSCGATRQKPPTASENGASSSELAAINKKLDDLGARVDALELQVLGKTQSALRTYPPKSPQTETIDERINRLQKEMTETLKNVVEWKKEIDALRKPAK